MEEINKIQNKLKSARIQHDYEFNLICAQMNFEIWKQIDSYNYSVSNLGNVRNDENNRILKPVSTNDCGYVYVSLLEKNSGRGGKRKQISIHRLVAFAFIPNFANKKCVDHINNTPNDNRLQNLRWATNQENHYNIQLMKTNTSGAKGVTFDKRRKTWHARIMINGKDKHIGYYDTIEEAAVARQKKAKEIQGEFMNSCEK